jgi:hypothetical protein
MARMFFVLMLGYLFFSIWATRTGLGLPVSELDPISIRQESTETRPYGHRRRFAGGGYRRGK